MDPGLQLNVRIQLPQLWGNQTFQKSEWGPVNFLVGPNGTGKSLFAERLKDQCSQQGMLPRYLSAERLTGLERQSYGYFTSSQLEQGYQIPHLTTYKTQTSQYGLSSSAFVLLKEKLDLRTRIEAILSQLFDRDLTLSQETGFLKPTVRRSGSGAYDLKRDECHGLKELISLLTFLYDDENNCLILDEPELHLHPQFQVFFLQQIREMAGDPRIDRRKKCFFLITHSPYYVDVRTPGELRHCLVFHRHLPPTYIETCDANDTYKLSRLLPRLNTHHKQFFFAGRPVFVEGYTDQQLFTLIQERRGLFPGAAGACFIDVGGKEELDLFFRLCKKLQIDAQFVGDLDLMLRGTLRQSVALDSRCREYMQREGADADPMSAIGKVDQALGECVDVLRQALAGLGTRDAPLECLYKVLVSATPLSDPAKELDRKRLGLLTAISHIEERLILITPQLKDKLCFIAGRVRKICEAFQKAGVHVLQKGELEAYLPEHRGNPFAVSDKEKASTFERERDALVGEISRAEVEARYPDLVKLLDGACPSHAVSFDARLMEYVQDWVFKVQAAFERRRVADADSLKAEPLIEWQTYSRLFEVVECSRTPDGFRCRIKMKHSVDQREREIEFDHTTRPLDCRFP